MSNFRTIEEYEAATAHRHSDFCQAWCECGNTICLDDEFGFEKRRVDDQVVLICAACAKAEEAAA